MRYISNETTADRLKEAIGQKVPKITQMISPNSQEAEKTGGLQLKVRQSSKSWLLNKKYRLSDRCFLSPN